MRDRLSRKQERQCPINSLYLVSKFSLPNPAKLPENRQESFRICGGLKILRRQSARKNPCASCTLRGYLIPIVIRYFPDSSVHLVSTR